MNFFKYALIASTFFLGACSPVYQTTRQQAEFSLFVDVTPKNAIILIDDEIVGNGEHTAETPLKIEAGTKRVAIIAQGYYPFKTTLEYIQPGETYTLKTHLIAEDF